MQLQQALCAAGGYRLAMGLLALSRLQRLLPLPLLY